MTEAILQTKTLTEDDIHCLWQCKLQAHLDLLYYRLKAMRVVYLRSWLKFHD